MTEAQLVDAGLLGADWGVSVPGVLLGLLVGSLTAVSLAAEEAWPTDLREPPFRVLIGVEELRVAICVELTCAHGVTI